MYMVFIFPKYAMHVHTYIATYACTNVFTVCGLPLVGPPTPQFDYCISYNDGEPALQVISYVCTYSLVVISA